MRKKIYGVSTFLQKWIDNITTAIGSILILPAFGLCFDNAWELKESNVSLVLTPISESAKKEAASGAGTSSIYGSPKNGRLDITTDPAARQIFSEL